MQTKTNEAARRAAGAIAGRRQVVKRDPGQWAQICEAQRESAQTVEAYCREHGIAQSSFWRWRKIVAGVTRHQLVAKSEARFLSVPLLAPTGQPVEVDVGGMRVRVCGAQATRIIDALVARIESEVAR